MEDMNEPTQSAPAEEVTQDGIHALLKAFLFKKGALGEKEANTPGWHPGHDKVFKDYAYFPMGVKPPVTVPSSLETIPEQIANDPDWQEIMGSPVGTVSSQASPEEVQASLEIGAAGTVPEDGNTPVGGAPVKELDNGDLSFVLNTGVFQQRPPTEGEKLATEVADKTAKVADEISTGEKVTEDMIDDKGKYDDLPDETAPPAPEPAASPENAASKSADDDLDHIET